MIIEFQDGSTLAYHRVVADDETIVDDFSGMPMRKVHLYDQAGTCTNAWVSYSRLERYEDAVAGRLGFRGVGSRQPLGLLLQVNEPGGAN